LAVRHINTYLLVVADKVGSYDDLQYMHVHGFSSLLNRPQPEQNN